MSEAKTIMQRLTFTICPELLKGIGGRDELFIMILDIQKVFADGELARMASATEAAKALPV